jgi:hypothetical protein
MSNLKLFLKSLQRSGYPNSKTDVTTIARAMNYDLEFFVDDLIREIGQFKTDEFIEKTFSKLGLMSSPGLKIDMEDGVGGEPGSYVHLIVHSFNVGEGDEDYEEVWIHYSWGDSLLIDDEGEKTLEDVWDDVDMGTMGEFEDFVDEIKYTCRAEIFKKTGLVIHFDSQI